MRQIIQKSEVYNQPMCLAFMDYEKVFDSVETWAVLQFLQRCDVLASHRNVEMLYISMPLGLYKSRNYLNTSVLENWFKTLSWKGMDINGKYISHLRFADGIVIFAESLQDLLVQQMLNSLADALRQIGMSLDKTEIMINDSIAPEPITVVGMSLEVVQEYVYLGQTLRLGSHNFEKELNRRIQLGWAAFGKLRQVTHSSMS